MYIWSPESCQKWSLNIELGVIPEYCPVQPQKQTKREIAFFAHSLCSFSCVLMDPLFSSSAGGFLLHSSILRVSSSFSALTSNILFSALTWKIDLQKNSFGFFPKRTGTPKSGDGCCVYAWTEVSLSPTFKVFQPTCAWSWGTVKIKWTSRDCQSLRCGQMRWLSVLLRNTGRDC